MYRVGFGDCFLLSIRSNGKLEHILIDCGAHYADLETIPQAVDNIAHETNGQLALVIATHNHKDHVSGFATCEKRFSDFKVGEVWLPWTMDPEDSEARRLREKQETLAAQLAFGLSAAGSRPELTAMLDNFAGPAMYDRELGIRNRHALEVLTYGFHRRDGKNGPPRVRYLAAHFGTNEPLQGPPMLSCLKATLLAPARSKPFMAMMDPPKGHHFLGLAGGIRKTQKRAVRLSPFGEEWRVPSARYVSVDLWPPDMKSTLSGVLPDDIIPLARWLEDAINNTSLVVHFSVMGKNLLFPGDAQWGSWISWMFENGDTARGLSARSQELLSCLDFLKVAHHGSVNATPRELVANLAAKAAVMCSTNRTAAYPQVPLSSLLDAFDRRTENRLVLSDQIDIDGNEKAHKDLRERTLPSCYVRGPFWIDYTM